METERSGASEEQQEQAQQARCAVHPTRGIETTCARCSNGACLDCAIPFRGEILCVRCATSAVGEPVPAAGTAPSGHPVLSRLLLIAFGLGVLATIPPWHRFGILTSPLSAWTLDGGPSPLVACLGLAAGLILSIGSRIRRSPVPALGSALASAGAVLGSALALATAPAYVSLSPAPVVALGAAILALGTAFLNLRRRGKSALSPGASP